MKRSYYLRMVDINRRAVLWEHELYYQISYVQERKQFHSFAGQDFMIGFNFADAEEAHTFYEAVQVKIDEYKKKLNTKNTPGLSLTFSRFDKSYNCPPSSSPSSS